MVGQMKLFTKKSEGDDAAALSPSFHLYIIINLPKQQDCFSGSCYAKLLQ